MFRSLRKKSYPSVTGKSLDANANEGFAIIKNQVENYEGPQMTELADRFTIANKGSIVNAGRVTGNAVPVLSNSRKSDAQALANCEVMSSNIVEEIIPLNVRRTSYNIAAKLPFIAFAPVNVIEQYQSIFGLLNNLPTGCTVAVTQTTRALVFTYTSGLNVDTIEITTDFGVPYPVVLKMLETDYIKAKGMKYTAENGNYDAQFNAFSITAGRSTLFGAKQDKSLPISSFKRADQQQNNIVNIDATMYFNGRRFFALGMAQTPPAGATESTIKLDLFVTEYGSAVDFFNC